MGTTEAVGVDARRVTVTGGASFIGSHLTELLVKSGASVTVADDFSSGRIEHLADCSADIELVVGDLRDPDVATRACADAEIVIHLAARHGGRGYIDEHPVDCVGNASLDHTVFGAAVRGGAGRIVFASSACVYPVDSDPGSSQALLEDDANFGVPGAAFADGEYGWAKLYGELQLAAFAREFGVDAIVCRIFNAYGPRENDTHAVIALIDRAIRQSDPYVVWGDGTQRRSFTYVTDVAAGLAAAASHPGSLTVNLGSPTDVGIAELCESIFAEVGWRPSTIACDLSKPVGSHSRRPDLTRARSTLGWAPRTTLADGLRATIADRADRHRAEPSTQR